MPPKKDKKAPVAGLGGSNIPTVTITAEELEEANHLPEIRDFVFTNLYAFRMRRNESRLQAAISKLYSYYNTEDPAYTEEQATRFRSIEIPQLLAQAAARGLISKEEAEDPTMMDEEKRVNAYAQATVESVTAFQLPLRRKKGQDGVTSEKADKISKKELTSGADTDGAGALSDREGHKDDVEQVILLKDFPKTVEDVNALMKHGMSRLHGIFLIEEIFNRELDNSDEEDEINEKRELEILGPIQPTEDGMSPKRREKLFNNLKQRADVFEALVGMNRSIQSHPGQNFIVKRMPFEGPANPMEIPELPEDGSEPPEIDEERKVAEFAQYDRFAAEQRGLACDLGQKLATYKQQLFNSQQKLQQLWPADVDPVLEAKRQQLAELRQSQQEEAMRKAMEEKKAADSKGKGGKTSGLKSNDDQKNETPEPQFTAEEIEELSKPQVKSQDDILEKNFDFLDFKKALSELKMGDCSVGTMLGSMVYQVGQEQRKKEKESLKDEFYNEASTNRTILDKKMSSRMIKKQETAIMEKISADEKEMYGMFDEISKDLTKANCLVETDYKHEFDPRAVAGHGNLKSSPYMIVRSANDKLQPDPQAASYKYRDGRVQDSVEMHTLETCLIPGVNKRLDMPAKPLLKQAVRDSDTNRIIQFCRLPANQTRRCLLLKGFEDMMKGAMKERTFSFLDRNYLEEHKEANTLRQVLSNAILLERPDVATKYHELDDGLLVALYYKNPPGRLLRRQWSAEPRVFPNFSEWANHVRDPASLGQLNKFLDVPQSSVGFLKENVKFSFPSDNSIIRTVKNQAGCRRMGESQIVKDNFLFGLIERKDVLINKVDGEDGIRNRDANKHADRRSDFWLIFENGVRLSIEMADGGEADMNQSAPFQLPDWLKNKINKGSSEKLPEVVSALEGSVMDSNLAQDIISKSAKSDQDEKPDDVRSSKKSAKGSPKAEKTSIKSVSGRSGQEVAQDEKPESAPVEEITETMPKQESGALTFEGTDMSKGARLSFSFNEGLVVQIQPNGDCFQKVIDNPQMPKAQSKGNGLFKDAMQTGSEAPETHRVITFFGEVIRYLDDENIVIYYPDGTITSSDKRRGLWYTTNTNGVKRTRRIKDSIIFDDELRLKSESKVDPETNATLLTREDGLLMVDYVDTAKYIIFPDGTQILSKNRPDGEAGRLTIVTKEGYVPVRQTFDPVKNRQRYVIGLGGTDALMGRDSVMERANTGMVSEVLLPDKTVVQTYLERQELPGYDKFDTNMVHIVRRYDHSIVKVKQDGEVVLISANERAYLNDIGNQVEDFGTKDYDYFFELFGIANERRSGVYTANLDQGRIWMQDEEGNYFIVYANGDSVEKMSVSFNLDQSAAGIDKKEPDSPRNQMDGEYIEDECKFLLPPKSMAHPRLFYVRADGTGAEFCNEEQLRHTFRSYKKTFADSENVDLIQTSKNINVSNEGCISHSFIEKKNAKFNASAYDVSHEFPKLPQTLDMVNQTVSIATEPAVENYTAKEILEFRQMDENMIGEFLDALKSFQGLKKAQEDTAAKLTIKEPSIITTAAPPVTDMKMRTTNMQSTFNSGHSPRGSDLNGSMSNMGKPSPRSTRSRKTMIKSQMTDQDSQQAKIEDKDEALEPEDLQIDERSGQILYENDLKLTAMQKLQLRIAQERGVNLDHLKGPEYTVLKEYKKLEERKAQMNSFGDFF